MGWHLFGMATKTFRDHPQKFGDDPQTEKPETVRKTQKTRFLAVFATLTKNVPQRHEKAKNAKNAFFGRFRGTPPRRVKKRNLCALLIKD